MSDLQPIETGCHGRAEQLRGPSQLGVEGVAQGLDLVSQAEDAFARNADVTENRGAPAGGPILEGLAARSYPVLRM
jgi:hypothetical protein